MPATYNGNISTIDPDDANVWWNSTASRWEVTFDVTGFSGFFIKTISQVLPVVLTSFEVTKHENTSRLSWNTTSEVNSERFEIQRSKDGKNWEGIGSVVAMGTKFTAKNYFFDDYSPIKGENLYRLKIVDLDGSFAYSRIRNAVFEQSNLLVAYPNPVKDRMEMEVGIEYLGTDMKLFDATGKTLKQFKVRKQIFPVDLSVYGLGIYFFQTYDGKTVRVLKH